MFCFHPPEQREHGGTAWAGQTPSRDIGGRCSSRVAGVLVTSSGLLPPQAPAGHLTNHRREGRWVLGECGISAYGPLQWTNPEWDKHSCPDSWAPWPIWAFCSWGWWGALQGTKVCGEKMLAGLVRGLWRLLSPRSAGRWAWWKPR